MANHILIETPDGEQLLVLSMVGHEDCKVLEEGVTPPRLPGMIRQDGRWRCKDKHITRLHHLAARPRHELAQKVLESERRLDELTTRLTKAGL